MEVAFEHVLLPKIVEKGVFTSQNRQNSQIFPKKIQKSCPENLLTFFLLHFLGWVQMDGLKVIPVLKSSWCELSEYAIGFCDVLGY